MKDIQTRDDLERLFSEFYILAKKDELIGHHFVEMDLESHLPVIVDFWDKTLFGNPVYFGNPMFVHHLLHQKAELRPDHFERWKLIFAETVDRLFAGETAELAKARSQVIAESLSNRLNDDAPIYTQIPTNE